MPSGEVRWINALAKVDYTEDGTPLRFLGISLDITERKRAEEALRKAEECQRQKREELETILAAIPAAVLIAKDAGCSDIMGNPAAHRLRRVPSQMSLSKSAASGKAPNTYDVFSNGCRLSPCELPMQRAASTKMAVVAEELELRFAEGDVRFERANALPLFDEAGEVCGAVGVFTDTTDLKRTEVALRESEARLRLALDAANAGNWEMDIETGRAVTTDRALALKGLPPGTAVARENVFGAAHPEDLPRLQKASLEALERGSFAAIRSEARRDSAAGKRAALEVCARSSESRNLGVRAGNRRIHRIGSRTRHARRTSRYAHVARKSHRDRHRAVDAALQAARDGKSFRVEFRMPLPDGSIRWVESCGEPRFVSGRQVISGLLQNITERKRAELALRESEERLKCALQAANAGTGEIDLETGEVFASERTKALLGLPPGAQLSPESALAGLLPEDRVRIIEAFGRILATGQPYRLETRVPMPDGSIRWLESHGELRSVSGKRVISGLVQDITERKRAGLALRESEALLRSIVEHAPVTILLSREDRKILLINPALTKLTGYTHSDIPTRDEWEVYAYREYAEQVKKQASELFERELPSDRGVMWVHTKSGEKRLWAIKTAPAGRHASGKRLMVSVALDITERHKSADEARANRSKLEAALTAMRDAVFICDAEGRFVHFNEAFASFHKCKSKADCARTFAEYPALLDVYWPSGELAPLDQWSVPRALRGETALQAEYTLRRKDTGETWVGSYNFAPFATAAVKSPARL